MLLIHQFKHMFWVLKRTVSLVCPQHIIKKYLSEKYENNFLVYSPEFDTVNMVK